jgi:hypothetical protein
VLFNAVVFCEDQSTGDGWMNECAWSIDGMTKTLKNQVLGRKPILVPLWP